MLPQIKEFIKNPIIKDGLIFALSPPLATDKTLTHKGYIVVMREVSRFDIEKKPEIFLYFLSNVMRKMMKKLDYIEISQSRKFITTSKKIDVENVVIYPGFRLNFELLDNGYFLTVDTTKKIVRNESVLEYINYLYKSYENMERD